MSQPQVVEIINELSDSANLPKPIKVLSEHSEVDEDGNPKFEIPLYNVWAFGKKTNSYLTNYTYLMYIYTYRLYC